MFAITAPGQTCMAASDWLFFAGNQYGGYEAKWRQVFWLCYLYSGIVINHELLRTTRMFKNGYQGGSYFEVFSAQAKDAISAWKQTGSPAKKQFDKEARSFVYVIEGSAATTKIQIPKDSKQSLTLIQRFLVIQLCVPKGLDFSIDLSVFDSSNQKRRLVLSTTYKETKTNPLHSKIPLGFIKRSKWLNLCLDMLNLVSETWHGQTYKCIDCICIAGNCKLRRIFTMKNQPLDTTDDEELYGFTGINDGIESDGIPRQCQLATDIPQAVQVVTMTKVRYFEGRGGPAAEPLTSRTTSLQDLDLSSSGGKQSSLQDNYHIAFGTKITGSGQHRKGSGKERTSSSQPHKSTHNRVKSDTSAESLHTSRALTDSLESKDRTQFVKPHPPREPSSEKRRKPRVKSAGQEHTSSQISKDESSSAYSSMNSSRGASQSRSNSGNKSTRSERAQASYQQPKTVANDDEVEQIMHEMAQDFRRSETESDGSHNTSDIQVVHSTSVDPDLVSYRLSALNGQDLRYKGGLEYEDSDTETKGADEEGTGARSSETLYTFVSRPKAVEEKPKMESAKHERNSVIIRNRRQYSGPRKKENTSSLTNSSDENETESGQAHSDKNRNTERHRKTNNSRSRADINEQDSSSSKNLLVPQATKNNKTNGLLQVAPQLAKSPHSSQTRLSVNRRSLREITNEEWRKSSTQPYNVNKYQPSKVAEVTDSFEKHMLASLQRQMMESGSSSSPSSSTERKANKLHQYDNESLTISSDEDTEKSTLKITSGPRTHNYRDEMKILSQEFFNQSNPRDWGNVFSPPVIVSSGNDDEHISSCQEPRTREGESDGDEVLDLLYDPVLNCYYDPVSCKYYELV